MLHVPTYVGKSNVHGLGLFAGKKITRGDIVWKFEPEVDIRLNPKDFSELLEKLTPEIRSLFTDASYLRNGIYNYMSDNSRFINHCESGANISLIDDNTEVALRDIFEGEELLENYHVEYDSEDYFFSIYSPEEKQNC